MDPNSSQDSIQVFIRIKPTQEQQTILSYSQTQIKLPTHQFAFDKIFTPQATQEDIFHLVGHKLLNNVLDGYNSCVFVYGQTGSGKTHTMIGQNNGLMQQSFNELFSRINRMKNAECLVTCSYFELYNEQIMDLIEPKKDKKLNIRQDAKKGVFVQNLAQETVLDCNKIMEILYTGMKNRHIGQTQMNRESSRSHSVFTISLSCKMQQNGKKILKTPKLHFVDLAGSQRQKMTQASGDRLKEAGNINKSLTTLGMVINALTSEKPRTHIPYRDSKLTCLLRDSLGGNSKTIIIATVSSLAMSFQETLSTLNFANRAKMVKVKALVNQESLSTNIQVFKDEIRRLKAEILRLKSDSHHRTPIKVVTQEIPSPKQIGNELQHHFEEINRKISAISDQLSQGITSPSLQMMLNSLQNQSNKMGFAKKPTSQIGSTQTMMEEQQTPIEEQEPFQKSASSGQFIEYLNSNYELLSEINTKINQYMEMKEQLRHAALNKKLSIQSMLTPSKFQRDQYEELLVKRQNQIRILQEKVETLEIKCNSMNLEKKELEKKMEMYNQRKDVNNDQIEKVRDELLRKDMEIEKQRTSLERLKSQLIRTERLCQEMEQRYKQTKELHLYAEQKYQNELFTSSKLRQKLQESEKQLQKHKKSINTIKEQKTELINDIQDLKLKIEDKEQLQEELRNELMEMQETIGFNRKMMEEMGKKNLALINQLNKTKQQLQQSIQKIIQLEKQNQGLRTDHKQFSSQMATELSNKCYDLTQSLIRNEELTHHLSIKTTEIEQLKQQNLKQLNEMKQKFQELTSTLESKQILLNRTALNLSMKDEQMLRSKKESDVNLNNYIVKYEAKVIECNIFEEKYLQFKAQSQSLIDQLKKQAQTLQQKNQTLSEQNTKLQEQHTSLQTQWKQAQKKIASIQNIYDENEQLKKSYKQLIKQNYRLKGKYQSFNQNEELQKQKNEELLAKVEFYEEKFKLMSIEYHKIEGIVKKLKEKELQANKKIQFYEENIKLLNIQKNNQYDDQEKNQLICELKDENRELKYKLDSLEGNMSEKFLGQKSQNCAIKPKGKQEKQSLSLSLKYQKFKSKLAHMMKNYEGFTTRSQQDLSTQDMMDLCELMLNENSIKFETIAKGIKKEKKLMSQNQFIIKQNIYLQEKIKQLEKGVVLAQEQDRPRKLMKVQRTLSNN